MMVTGEPAHAVVSSAGPRTAPAVNVLCVDDEPQVLRVMTRCLDSWGYRSAAASSVAQARGRLDREEYVLVLCDVNMPGESGIDLLRTLSVHRPDVATVMVTGHDDPGFAEMALDLGAYGYVIKPFAPNELRISIANALRRRSLELESLAYRDLLELTVRQRTSDLKQAVTSLEEVQAQLRLTGDEMIVRLSLALESRDANTGGHTERVSRYALTIARELGLDDERCEMIRTASPLHDVGKIAVPDAILLKRGRLTPRERTAMESHTDAGYHILAGSQSALLDLAATIALTHHERYDGNGYPRRLSGVGIPLEGRIVAVADVFDALTSDRPYRRRLTLEDAIALVRGGRGSQFDPEVVDSFIHSRAPRDGGPQVSDAAP
jgi:putative two-component system response regulator